MQLMHRGSLAGGRITRLRRRVGQGRRETRYELIALRHGVPRGITTKKLISASEVRRNRGMEIAGGRIKIPAGPARRAEAARQSGILTICRDTSEESFKSPVPTDTGQENYFPRWLSLATSDRSS